MVISNGGDSVPEVGCFKFKFGWCSAYESIDKEKEQSKVVRIAYERERRKRIWQVKR